MKAFAITTKTESRKLLKMTKPHELKKPVPAIAR